jgi:hypothetical protein
MPSRRPLVISLVVGVVHAAGLLAVALHLGYAVGPTEYPLSGIVWRYGGLVVMATLPVWLGLRYRLAAPLGVLTVTTGYVLGMELTPPDRPFAMSPNSNGSPSRPATTPTRNAPAAKPTTPISAVPETTVETCNRLYASQNEPIHATI